ncbi:MAG: ComEC family competence protein [Phycisphaerales bacterium]|nr:ComEC family competence protein [Phycisphaerales bacterium]
MEQLIAQSAQESPTSAAGAAVMAPEFARAHMWEYFWPRNPLVPVAALLAGGIGAGAAVSWHFFMLWCIAAACLAAWAFCRLLRIGIGGAWALVPQLLLAAAVFCGGMGLWQLNQRQVPPGHIALSLPAHGASLITARMEIISSPQLRRPQPGGPLFSIAAPRTTFIGEMLERRIEGRWRPACGKVLVQVPGDLPALKNNQQVQVVGWLSRPPGAGNPGQFNYRSYLAAERIFAQITAKYSNEITIIHARQTLWPLAGWIDSTRAALRRRLRATALPGANRETLDTIALLLGFRDPAIREVARQFSRSGAAHLLALSGLHVVIIAAGIWLVLRLIIRRPRPRAIACIFAVLAYMLITPCGPPVLRASLATVLVLATLLVGRPVQILNIIAFTAIVVLLLNPAELFSPPFQLSFLVTAGLILLGGRCHRAIFGRYLLRAGEVARIRNTTWGFLWLRLQHTICGILTCNIIGSVIAFPLVAYHFNQMNPLAIISGLLLLPLVTAALILGLAQLLAAVLWLPLGKLVALAAYPVGHILIWLVGFLAGLPGGNIVVRSPAWWVVLLMYAAMAVWAIRRPLKLSRATALVALTAATVVLTGWYTFTQPSDDLRMDVLDVGSGNCAVAQLADGTTVAINAGTLGSPVFLCGQVNAFLRHCGLWPLKAVLTAKIDANHAAAAIALGTQHGAAALLCSAADKQQKARQRSIGQFFQMCQQQQLKTVALARGDVLKLAYNIRCEVLWPPRSLPPHSAPSYRSLVLRLRCGSESLLVCDKTQLPWVASALGGQAPVATVLLTGPGRLHRLLEPELAAIGCHTLIASGESTAIARQDAALAARWPLVVFSTRRQGCIRVQMNRSATQVKAFMEAQDRAKKLRRATGGRSG